MIRIILEGRDALVYHCTDILSAMKILKSNKLKPLNRSYSIDKPCVCVTRDKNYAVADDSLVQFALDQKKLIYKYKMSPTAESGFGKDTPSFEAEERIFTEDPIPINKYLIEIDYPMNRHSQVMDIILYIDMYSYENWDDEARAMYQLYEWYQDGTYKFGKNYTKLFTKYKTTIENSRNR